MPPQIILNDDDEEDGGSGWWMTIQKHLNFYRVHLMYYTFTPLIFSGIFYACNGRYHISYIDALFNCVSAMAVCGLVTVNLSSLTGWQQAILFIQMCIGNPIIVSWLVVYQRRHYLAAEFEHILEASAKRREENAPPTNSESHSSSWPRRIFTLFRRERANLSEINEVSKSRRDEEKIGIIRQLRPEMIRRVDDEPKRINPSGLAVPLNKVSTHTGQNHYLPVTTPAPIDDFLPKPISRRSSIGYDGGKKSRFQRRLSDPGVPSRPGSPVGANFLKSRDSTPTAPSPGLPQSFTRTQTIEFAPNVVRRRGRSVMGPPGGEIPEDERPNPEPLQHHGYRSRSRSRGASLSHQPSVHTHHTTQTRLTSRSSKLRGFGGFPMPFAIIATLFNQIFPRLRRKVTRTITIPATMSLVSQQRDVPSGAKSVPYISFNAVVGRNSAFHDLSHEEMEELGGVEYRALNALLWIVGGYHLATQLVAFVVIAPYISTPKWRHNFVAPDALRPVSPVWFSIFQTATAYTNTGMSLVDRSMVPFQTAYPMIFFLVFLILAGNTGFPVFLRFTIWIMTKLVPRSSRANETLHFLLDHPRRCFMFLFPSHQTWFLLTVVFALTAIDWFFFLILDIGNSVVEAIPLGTRFVVGLLQATAVRCAGFSAVSVASLAAGVKVLYVVMMYISAYPIAMSVRSTNVYEEQSLGIFPEDNEPDEEDFEPTGPRMTVWSRYLAMHARKQLAFDMWWLGLALFLLCINERHNLDDPSSAIWFNIFSVVFELVSAYGTVGLSLGVPNDNYSFAGALKPFSKFILCLVMLRGRHRILPVAIDRAVMLPSDLQRYLDQNKSQYNQSNYTREDNDYDARFDQRRYSSQLESRRGGDDTILSS